jgi:hypothetical protein
MSDPQYIEFSVSSHSHTVRVPYWPGGEMEERLRAFRDTYSDEDFDALCDWARDEIQFRIEFDIEEVL